ncbi:MAG: PD-(D/E)XK nuclease family protein [Clostridia bacterium]|nr:PD-(D/E)XK nuclease family protein [Clostridia bacterium]
MVRFIYGGPCSDRSSYLYKLAVQSKEKGNNALVIVPEQQVLDAEGKVSELDCGHYVEVTSFKRLCNDIFRKYGGLSYNYIGKGAKIVIMWRAISSVASMLCEYKSVTPDDLSVAEMMVALVDELKMCGVTPADVENIRESCEDIALSRKLADITLIYSRYTSMLSEGYDDARDDITRAAETVKNKSFFKDKDIFVDSFDGYTGQELVLLERIFSQCGDINITLGYEKDDLRDMNTKLRKTDRALRKILSDSGRRLDEEISLESVGDIPDDIHFALDNFMRESDGEKMPFAENIKIIECADRFEEASFVAFDIAKKVQRGARYRDFAIIARKTSQYNGIIDTALDSCDIPYHLSQREGIMTMPEMRMIGSALLIKIRGWRNEDVISYMRCGLSGLSLAEADAIEGYASTWRISGKRWYDEKGWTMNPRGYTADMTDSVRSELEIINSYRKKLTKPLERFFAGLDASVTVKDISTSIYNFLSEMGVRETLSRKAEMLRAIGDESSAEESATSWNSLMNLLDDLVSAAGDTPVSLSEYISLLRAVASEIDIGKLPSRSDEVIIAGADLVRHSQVKYVYVLGLKDGEFPLSVSQSGILNENERAELADLGLTSFDDGDDEYCNELLYFYKSLSLAKNEIYLVYGISKEGENESVLVDSVGELFDSVTRIKYSDIPELDKTYGYFSILEYVAKNRDAKLIDALKESGRYFLADSLSCSLTAENDRISEELALEFHKKNMKLSQSKVELYVKCPFAFHCRYILGLDEGRSGEFESVDVGNFVHKILEIYFSRYSESFRSFDDEKIKSFCEEIVDDFVYELWNKDTTSRINGLVKRLKKLSVMLIKNITEEFENSDFVPAFFEMPIGYPENSKEYSDAAVYDLPDGAKAVISGKVDRIDVYRKGKDAYIRVVDYKTGVKEFSLKDVEEGINMQMLIYLFALSSENNEKFKNAINAERVIPAGIMYFPARMADKMADPKKSDEALLRENFRRNGYLLEDEEILSAMDKLGSGLYIPTGKNLYSLSTLGEVKKGIEKTLVSIATRMREGEACAKPRVTKDSSPCNYCAMKPLCRSFVKSEY